MATGWKVLADKIRRIQAKQMGGWFESVTLMKELSEREDFLASMKEEGKRPADYLRELLGNTSYQWAELSQMLQEFPTSEEWTEAGNLRTLRERTIARVQERNRPAVPTGGDGASAGRTPEEGATNREKVGREAPHLSWKEQYLELKDKYVALEAKCEEQEKEIRRLHKILERQLAAAG